MRMAEASKRGATGPLVLAAILMLHGCSNDDGLLRTSAGFPPVEIPASGLPTYAVGDSFTFDNPDETWTVASIVDGIVSWQSSLGATKQAAFDPFLPPVEWETASDKTSGIEKITAWNETMFPLDGGKKASFQSRATRSSAKTAVSFERKCYAGKPRLVTVEAGSFPAYPVFCRRNDGHTAQYFYAPKINSMLLITTRARPAPARTRELIRYSLAKGARVAASTGDGLPQGWAIAAIAKPNPSESEGAPEIAVATATETQTDGERVPEGRAVVPSERPIIEKAAPQQTRPKRVAPTGLPQPPTDRRPTVAAAPIVPASPSIPAPPPTISPPPVSPAVAPIIVPPEPVQSPPSPTLPSIAAPEITPSGEMAPPTIATAPASRIVRIAPSDRYGVQVGSFRNIENAAAAWDRFQRRLSPILDTVPHRVVEANLGPAKGIYPRVIAGSFGARDEARTLCRAIRERGSACLVKDLRN